MRHFLYIIAFIFVTCLPVHAMATKNNANIDQWKSLPVLHEGRVKPIDSFARVMLSIFTGHDNVQDLSASEWLAESLFNPTNAVSIPAFKIRDFKNYGLKESPNNLYNFLQLSNLIKTQQPTIMQLLNVEPQEWTPQQQSLMKHHENFILYTQILRSFTSLLPLNLGDKGNKNFLSYQSQELENKLKNIVKNKGKNPDNYNAQEKEIAFLSYQLNLLKDGGKNNILFRIIPENFNKKDTNWLSYWRALNTPNKTPETQSYIDIWENITQSYITDNNKNFQQKVNNAAQSYPSLKLKTETFYNTLNLIKISLIIYSICFALIILSTLIKIQKQKLEKLAFYFLNIGMIAHGAHIALRVFILERPPVGTLYESILFVSLISVIGCAYLAFKKQKTINTLIGSLIGIILLVIATGFSGEDNMNTLVAVLNTNFWLATHVLCITIGYATCFIASFMAHYWLVAKNIAPNGKNKDLTSNIKTLIILSLLFTTIGTILGGIWADQSWGRFWGWDPKENGALLIVLWLAWMLHGRMSGHLNKIAYMAATAYLSVIVTLAWFGVNLLSVGLHSYGFISGIAWSIGLFCTFETLIIGALWTNVELRKRKP